MPINVLMPALSPTMTEGNLAKWHKKEGDIVKAGDVIAEIETDKATMEVEAVDEGRIGKILIPEGTQAVKVNEPIAILLEEGESDNALSASSAPAPTASKSPEAKVAPSPAPLAVAGTAVLPVSASEKKGDRVFASPLAKRIASQKGIDLSSLKGTGPHGRIVKADLEATSSGQGAKAPTPAQNTAIPKSAGPDAKKLADLLGMEYTEIPNSNIRKTIANRLLESKQTIPHFYLSVDCQLDNLLLARKQLNDMGRDKYKLSVNDFIIKAVANALAAYPAANVAWTDAALLQFKHADVSVAVATPNGLITPIIKKAETKGLKQISEEMKDLAKRARDGKLKPEEFQGGTFSISNLGMFGVTTFQAIINPPQACILAVGAGVERPYVSGKDIKIGTFMTCTLSVDHRAVDGAVGAEYLQVLKGFIESPASMLL